MRLPKISVIIPTYNRLDYLKEAATSVLKQTFDNYELIISDNHSSDGTATWGRALARNNSKVRYFRNKKNLGMVRNWNVGLDRARGKYLSVLNDDDLWEPGFLQETIKILDKKPNVGLVFVYTSIITNNGKSRQKRVNPEYFRVFKRSKEMNGVECIKKFLTGKWQVNMPSSILVRSECFSKLGKFDEIGLDLEMWLRICSKYDFYYLDKKLAYWRHHDLAYSVMSNPIDYFYERFRVLDKVIAYNYSKNDIAGVFAIKDKAYFKYRIQLLNTIFSSKNKKEKEELWKIYRLYSSSTTVLKDLLRGKINNILLIFVNLIKFSKIGAKIWN